MKKIFLKNLPKKKSNNNVIDWLKTKGCRVHFIYDNIEGEIEIVDSRRKNGKTVLDLKYLEQYFLEFSAGHFSICKIGEIVGKNTKKFRYEIGEVIEVTTGKIKIKKHIRNKQNKKEYIFECLECGWQEGIINEGNLDKRQGCGCCTNRTIVKGINDVTTTDPWMIPYFKNPKDAETRISGSYDVGLLHCPICKISKDNMAVKDLYRSKNVGCEVCNDGFSYPEKLVYSLLKQLNIKVKRHKRDFNWLKPYKKEYDFYIEVNDEEILIETHGLQHYKSSFGNIMDGNKIARTLKEEKENDRFKKELALMNGIKKKNYIVIDCRKSELEWIRDNILKSRLSKLLDLSNIDWQRCELETKCSYMAEACKYFNQGMTAEEVSDIMEINYRTIQKYLKRGKEYNLCDYKDTNDIRRDNYFKTIELWNNGIRNKEEMSEEIGIYKGTVRDYLKRAELEGKIQVEKPIKPDEEPKELHRKPIKSVEYGNEFKSINEAYTKSKEVFGIELFRKGITRACDTGDAYKGLHFQYI